MLHVDSGKVTWYPGNYDYFARRHAEREAELASARPTAETPKPAAPEQPAPPRPLSPKQAEKEERRREELKKRLDELTRRLEDPAIYADYAKVRELTAEIEALQADLGRVQG